MPVTIGTCSDKPVLTATKNLVSGTVFPDNVLTYSVTVYNVGEVAATSVQATDSLPGIVITSDPSGLFGAGALIPAGASATAEYTYTVDGNDPDVDPLVGLVTNLVSVTSAEGVSTSARATAKGDQFPIPAQLGAGNTARRHFSTLENHQSGLAQDRLMLSNYYADPTGNLIEHLDINFGTQTPTYDPTFGEWTVLDQVKKPLVNTNSSSNNYPSWLQSSGVTSFGTSSLIYSVGTPSGSVDEIKFKSYTDTGYLSFPCVDDVRIRFVHMDAAYGTSVGLTIGTQTPAGASGLMEGRGRILLGIDANGIASRNSNDLKQVIFHRVDENGNPDNGSQFSTEYIVPNELKERWMIYGVQLDTAGLGGAFSRPEISLDGGATWERWAPIATNPGFLMTGRRYGSTNELNLEDGFCPGATVINKVDAVVEGTRAATPNSDPQGWDNQVDSATQAVPLDIAAFSGAPTNEGPGDLLFNPMLSSGVSEFRFTLKTQQPSSVDWYYGFFDVATGNRIEMTTLVHEKPMWSHIPGTSSFAHLPSATNAGGELTNGQVDVVAMIPPSVDSGNVRVAVFNIPFGARFAYVTDVQEIS